MFFLAQMELSDGIATGGGSDVFSVHAEWQLTDPYTFGCFKYTYDLNYNYTYIVIEYNVI